LLHFIGIASWSDEKVLGKVREMVLPAIEQQGPIEAWIIDDTPFRARSGPWRPGFPVEGRSPNRGRIR
jgi:SRSO17 transposase